ncbi:MAG: hypothetical protein ACT4OO_14780 [Nitrospiraceae bacterium]
MFAFAGVSGSAHAIGNWNILLAREPEPDLEFTEEELDPSPLHEMSPKQPPKRSGSRPLLWVLLLVLIGGAAYLAMEPEMLMDLLDPILGGSSSKPKSTAPAPSPAPSPSAAPGAPAPAPTASDVQAPSPSVPSQPIPAPVTTIVPGPLFAEGQKVTVIVDPTIPGDTASLSLDSIGSRPGALVRVGATLTVLDGELQNNAWVYAVRSEDGNKGWIAEKRLKLRP